MLKKYSWGIFTSLAFEGRLKETVNLLALVNDHFYITLHESQNDSGRLFRLSSKNARKRTFVMPAYK